MLALCAAPVVALLAVAVFAPLPFSVAQPGATADVLGESKGRPVIELTGKDIGARGEGTAKKDEGKLLAVTIAATQPQVTVRIGDVVTNWFAKDRAVMPREAVYPEGDNVQEVQKHIAKEMKGSQNDAVKAALAHLHRSPEEVKVSLSLGDVGGPSAGLFFSLGIIDKLDGDGRGGTLTGGRTIAGTGTIDAKGKVGAVGGVPLKMKGAHRDGARHFLVPKKECSEAQAELPKGLTLIPVTTLDGAVDALKALKDGRKVPSC